MNPMGPDKPPVVEIPLSQWSNPQHELDRAMAGLTQARQQKTDRGCAGVFGCLASCLMAPLGIGLMGFGAVLGGLLGPLLFLGAIAVAFFSIRAISSRPVTLEEAKASIRELGHRLTGDEVLYIAAPDVSHLQKLLYEADPLTAIGILKVLCVCGTRESLWYIRAMTGATNDGLYFPASRDPRVQSTAVWAAQKLSRRLEVARQASTMLRPAAGSDQHELLRPATPAQAEPQFLLRASEDE